MDYSLYQLFRERKLNSLELAVKKIPEGERAEGLRGSVGDKGETLLELLFRDHQRDLVINILKLVPQAQRTELVKACFDKDKIPLLDSLVKNHLRSTLIEFVCILPPYDRPELCDSALQQLKEEKYYPTVVAQLEKLIDEGKIALNRKHVEAKRQETQDRQKEQRADILEQVDAASQKLIKEPQTASLGISTGHLVEDPTIIEAEIVKSDSTESLVVDPRPVEDSAVIGAEIIEHASEPTQESLLSKSIGADALAHLNSLRKKRDEFRKEAVVEKEASFVDSSKSDPALEGTGSEDSSTDITSGASISVSPSTAPCSSRPALSKSDVKGLLEALESYCGR